MLYSFVSQISTIEALTFYKLTVAWVSIFTWVHFLNQVFACLTLFGWNRIARSCTLLKFKDGVWYLIQLLRAYSLFNPHLSYF
jgi:hypothetical protein